MTTGSRVLAYLALALCTLSLGLSVQTPFQVWKKLPVNVDYLRQLAAVVTSVRATAVQCGARALVVEGKTIMCHLKDECFVLEEEHFFLVFGSHTVGWRCFSTGLTSCTLPDGSALEMYGRHEGSPGCKIECRPSGLEGIVTVLPIACCDGAMTLTDAGCISVLNDETTFVAAKTKCRDMGMDLFSATSQSDLDALLAVSSLTDKTFYVGYVKRVSGEWAWKTTLFHRKGDTTVEASAWATDYPNSDRYSMCAEAFDGALLNGLCNEDLPVVCHAPVPAC